MNLTIANLGFIDDDEFANVVAAITKQVVQDFQLEWGGNANIAGTRLTMTAAQVNIDVPSDAIIYVGETYQDSTSGIGGVHGYHSENHGNAPYGFVYLDVCQQTGENWTCTLSHEVLELLADPTGVYNIIGPSPKGDGTSVYFGLEVCDPTQGDTYPIDGIAVSNFVHKSYFGIPGGAPTTNHLKLDLAAFGLRPGGYLQYEIGGTMNVVNGSKVIQQRIDARSLLGDRRRNAKRAGKVVVAQKQRRTSRN